MGPEERQKLISWLVSGGGSVSVSIDPFRELAGVRGIFATAAIVSGTDLISVPAGMCLQVAQSSTDAARPSAGPEHPVSEAAAWLTGHVGGLGQFLSLVLVLMAETAAANASYFAPEIAALPASHSCLLAWSRTEAALLDGTSLEGAQPDLRTIFKGQLVPVMEQRRDLWPEDTCGYDATVLAAGMIQSRTFHINQSDWATGHCQGEGEELYLIPVIDMANHSTLAAGENAELRITARTNASAGGDGHSFVLTAKRNIAAGEEVCISYGELSDADLVQTYGFLEPLGGVANPHNKVIIRHSDVYDTGKALLLLSDVEGADAKERWATLDAAGVVPSSFAVTVGSPLPERLLTTVLAMGLDEESWEEFIGHHTPVAPRARDPQDEIPHLGMDFMKMLIEAGEAKRPLIMLHRIFRQTQLRNPLHAHLAQPPDAQAGAEGDSDAEITAVLHSAPPVDAGSARCSPSPASGISVVDREAAEAAASAAYRSEYREWCAKRVAAGELSIVRSALTVLAELVQSAEEALEAAGRSGSEESESDASEGSEESESDASEGSPGQCGKRQRL